MSISAFTGLAALLAALFVWLRKPKAPPGPLPPGPKPVPILGNILDLRAKELWFPAMEWAKKFGDVCYLHILGQGLVFVNSPEAVFELLDKRGSIYSDKPHLVMAGELCGCENMVAFTPYGDQSRRQRTLMQRAFGPQSIPTYHPLLEIETKSFLRRILVSPSDYVGHVRRYAGGLVLLVVYGYEASPKEDKFLSLAEECVYLLANRIASGAAIWPVDVFPFLRHIPMWFPGSGFKHNAIRWKAKMEEFVEQPYEYLKSSISDGTAVPSFCSTLLQDEEKTGDEFEFDLKWTANSMYSGGIDSTITVISQFILAMLLYPEVLAKAQKEIDTVIGTDRLPTFSDRASLKYVECVMSETLRWGAPVPLNLPHRLMEDDIYRGMHIPKGSLVIGNIWAMLRDEKLYPNPDAFIPERFMEEVDEATQRRRDPRSYVFGFGRRRCPGVYLIESSIWSLIVSILATLDINKAVDDFGNVIEPDVKYGNSVFRVPSPFKCDLRPRSEQALSLIKQTDIS